jgi:hypothetical protein
MSKRTWELSIDGAALEEMKSDFDRAINAAVMAMRQKEVQSSTITAKLEITFPEGSSTDGDFVLFPTFRHKVSTAMQYKSESTGFFGGSDYRLVWNPNSGRWNVRRMDEDQVSMDDSDGYPYSGDDDEA